MTTTGTPYEYYRHFICAAELYKYVQSESWSDSTIKDRLLKFVEEKVEAHYFQGTADDALDRMNYSYAESYSYHDGGYIKPTIEFAHLIMLEAEDLISTSDALEEATERVNRDVTEESESRGGPFNQHYNFYYDVEDNEDVKKAFNLTFLNPTDDYYKLSIDQCKRYGELLDCVDYLNSTDTETVTSDNVRNALLGVTNSALIDLLKNLKGRSLNRIHLLKIIERTIVESGEAIELQLGGSLAVLDLLINSAI